MYLAYINVSDARICALGAGLAVALKRLGTAALSDWTPLTLPSLR